MSKFNWLIFAKPASFGIFVFIISTSVCLFFSSNIKQAIVETNRSTLLAKSEKISVDLQEIINRSVFDLYTLQSFYNTHQDVSRSEFNQFTQFMLQGVDYIRAFEWIPKVISPNREAFVNKQKSELKGFSITRFSQTGVLVKSPNKVTYYPVTFMQPYKGNESALGFDLSSNPARKATLDYARDTGEITTTDQISLVQDQSSSKDFLMVAPIYHMGDQPSSTQLRREQLKGFVLGVFQVENLLRSVNKQAIDEGLELSLKDLNTKKSSMLYGKRVKPEFSFNIQVPQRTWQLGFTMNPVLSHKVLNPPIYSWAVLISLIISALLGLSAYALSRILFDSLQLKILNTEIQDYNQNLEAKVHERTRSLAVNNAELNKNVNQLTQNREALSELMTALKQQKDQAESKTIELEKSNEELDEFTYVVSHDLKAPLRGIDQLASWIEEDIDANKMEDVPKHLTAIRQRIYRLEKLLIDLLEYSKVGRHEEKLTQVNSQELIENVFMLNAPSNACKLSFNSPFPKELAVTAQFELIIRNLIGNAIKHSNRENLHLEFNCAEQTDVFTFSIKDNGPGIETKHFDQIFKMFKTLEPRDKVEGSGMGLALIKKVVNTYGGRVYVTSELGQGSTFYFDWPKSLKETEEI
ncbi:CHASE domain-containing protein [Marinomonas sp. PE14-40]|uniref:CHASE domain-containing protein n=1 Tax=Marinomonas sp. PE14-40 TaxID=3060621 RepID=UPI003F66E3A4